jgi:hypothetical protein
MPTNSLAQPIERLAPEPALDTPLDPGLQLLRGPLGEGERDDRLSRQPVGEQVDDPLGDELRLARPGRRDDLQMAAAVADGGQRVSGQLGHTTIEVTSRRYPGGWRCRSRFLGARPTSGCSREAPHVARAALCPDIGRPATMATTGVRTDSLADGAPVLVIHQLHGWFIALHPGRPHRLWARCLVAERSSGGIRRTPFLSRRSDWVAGCAVGTHSCRNADPSPGDWRCSPSPKLKLAVRRHDGGSDRRPGARMTAFAAKPEPA